MSAASSELSGRLRLDVDSWTGRVYVLVHHEDSENEASGLEGWLQE